MGFTVLVYSATASDIRRTQLHAIIELESIAVLTRFCYLPQLRRYVTYDIM